MAQSTAELAMIRDITQLRGLKTPETAKKNITQLRRVQRILRDAREGASAAAPASDAIKEHKSISNFSFVADVDACLKASESVIVTTRRQVLSALGNCAQVMASRATEDEERADLTNAAARYRAVMTSLNAEVDALHKSAPTPREEELFKDQASIRAHWVEPLLEHARAIMAAAPPSRELEPQDFFRVMLAVLVLGASGATLNPVRGAELSKLWTSQHEPTDPELTRNWAVRYVMAMKFNSHKAQKKHGTIEFYATQPWQALWWQVLEEYVPFLAVFLKKDVAEDMPLFVNRHRETFTASTLNDVLRASSTQCLGVPLGSRALRKLFASAHASILPIEGVSLGIGERAMQSLHTPNVAAAFYTKEFAPSASTVFDTAVSAPAIALLHVHQFSTAQKAQLKSEFQAALAALKREEEEALASEESSSDADEKLAQVAKGVAEMALRTD